MISCNQMEWETFIEESCTNNIHTGKKLSEATTFDGLWAASFQTYF